MLPALGLSLLLCAQASGASIPAPATAAPEHLELVGTVGALDVRMALDLEGANPSANYAYATGTGLLFLRGDPISPDGLLRLRTWPVEAGSQPEMFEGKLDRKARTYVGTWRQGSRKQSFSLRIEAHLAALGGTGPCSDAQVLVFEPEDDPISRALTAAARAFAVRLAEKECGPVELDGGTSADSAGDEGEWFAYERLWSMSDGLVSMRTQSGDGTARGSGMTSTVWDARKLPVRALALTDGAPDGKALTARLSKDAYAFLAKRHALDGLAVFEGGSPPAGVVSVGDRLEDWAVTPAGIQIFLRADAGGDGTVSALVPRQALRALYRKGSALGTWAQH